MDGMRKNPTYREIARACGVDVSTVSRALNHSQRLPEETRNRIRKVAERLGWRANPLAAAYMSHLRSTRPPTYKAVLGFVTDFPQRGGFETLPGDIKRCFRGAADRAASYGYSLQLFNLADPDLAPAVLNQALFHRNAAGVICARFANPGSTLDDVEWHRYAAIAIGRNLGRPALHRVAGNMHTGFALIIRKVLELGYRSIGVVVSEAFDQQSGHGIEEVAYYAQHHLPAGCVLHLMMTRREGPEEVESIARFLAEHRPQVAMGTYVWEAIRQLKWRVPQDISFVSINRDPSFRSHAGLDHHYELQGRYAADLLIGQINSNTRGVPDKQIDHLIPCSWVDGATAPPMGELRSRRVTLRP